MNIKAAAKSLINKAVTTDLVGDGGTHYLVSESDVDRLKSSLKTESPAEVVADINADIYALCRDTGVSHDVAMLVGLSYVTDGSVDAVEFLGKGLWDDQDNGIPWDDEKDEPLHTLKDHLLLKMAQTIRGLSPVANLCEKAVGK